MKHILLIALILMGIHQLQAQNKKHNLGLDFGVGAHQLNYDLNHGDVEYEPGLNIDISYVYYFNDNWGFGTGLGMQTFESIATINYLNTQQVEDMDGDSYEHRTNYEQWQEEQKMLSLNIPISINYRTVFKEKFTFLASTGAKINIPVSSIYQSKGGQITTTGYYSEWNVELKDLPQHNFTTHSEFPEGNNDVSVNCNLFIDAGISYQVYDQLDIYAGAYCGYGLSSAIENSDNNLLLVDGTYNGVLNSNEVDKANLISLGFKIGVRFGLPYFKNKSIN